MDISSSWFTPPLSNSLPSTSSSPSLDLLLDYSNLQNIGASPLKLSTPVSDLRSTSIPIPSTNEIKSLSTLRNRIQTFPVEQRGLIDLSEEQREMQEVDLDGGGESEGEE